MQIKNILKDRIKLLEYVMVVLLIVLIIWFVKIIIGD